MNASIGENEHPLAGESLGAVASNSVAVVEVTVFCRIKFDLPVPIKPGSNISIPRNRLDDCEIAVGNAELFVGRTELDAVANGELVDNLPVDADTGKPARVVYGRFTRRHFNA